MSTFNGIGTHIYGKYDLHQDGSYIATEWVVFVFLPLVPIKSYRIFNKSNKNDFYIVATTSKTSYKMKKVELCGEQIARTYIMFYAPIIAWIIFAIVKNN
jgi:hypothetical protein